MYYYAKSKGKVPAVQRYSLDIWQLLALCFAILIYVRDLDDCKAEVPEWSKGLG